MSKHLTKYCMGLGRLGEAAIAGDITKEFFFEQIKVAEAVLGDRLDHSPREMASEWQQLDFIKADEPAKRRQANILRARVEDGAPESVRLECEELDTWLAEHDRLKARFEPRG